MGLAIVLGWRDALTQLWAIQRSEASGETDKALQRAEALFRQEKAVLPAIVQLLNSPEQAQVVAKLASMLGTRPPWRDAFFNAARGLPGTATKPFAALVGRLAETGAPASADELSPLIAQLVASGETDDARLIWSAAHRRDLVANGGFERTQQWRNVVAPTDWNVSGQSGAKVDVVTAGQGKVLRIAASDVAGRVLSQDLMLGPGNYVLSYRARASGAPTVPVNWDILCSDSRRSQRTQADLPGDASWRVEGFSFLVPEQDCPIQALVLRSPVATPAAEILIDDVRIKPSAR